MFSFGFVSFFVLLYYPALCQGGVTIKCEGKEGTWENVIDSSNISLPGLFGKSYPANSNCTINTTADERISLQFHDFYVAGAMPNCSEDYVEVIVGCENPKSMGKYCSNLFLPAFHSIDGCMTIITVFKSDKERCLNGYVAVSNKNESVSSSCSKSNSNELLSMNWPNDYNKNSTCTWTQDVIGDAHAARFFFSSFNLEVKAECDSLDAKPCIDDEVIVYGISKSTKKALKRLCHTGEEPFDLAIAGYDKVEVQFCADKDDNIASGIAGGFVTYKKGHVRPPAGCRPTPTLSSHAVTASSPEKGSLLIMAILSFIMSKCCYH